MKSKKAKEVEVWNDSEVMPDPILLSKSIKYLVVSYVCHLSFNLYVISSRCRTLFPLYRCKSNLKLFLDTINYKNQRTYLIQFSSLLNVYSSVQLPTVLFSLRLKKKKVILSCFHYGVIFIMVLFLATDSSLQHYYFCNGF